MKRIRILIIILCLCFLPCLTDINASQNKEQFTINENKNEEIVDENEQRVVPKIFIYVGTTLFYTYANGKLEEVFGVSVLELSDQAFQAIVDAYNNIPNLYSIYLEDLNATYVKKYITTTGQQCVKQRQGANYICTYRLE